MNIKQLFTATACAVCLGVATQATAGGKPQHAGQPSENANERASTVGHRDEGNDKSSEQAPECSPDDGEVKVKPAKVRIAHCGCNEDGSDLVWKHIKVSTKAKGHLKHVPYSDENARNVGCLSISATGEEEEGLFKRGVSDCRLAGEEDNIGNSGGLALCVGEGQEGTDPLAGTSCSLVENPEPAS